MTESKIIKWNTENTDVENEYTWVYIDTYNYEHGYLEIISEALTKVRFSIDAY